MLKLKAETGRRVGYRSSAVRVAGRLPDPGLLLLGLAIVFSAFSPLGFTVQKIHFWKKQQAAMAALSPEDGRLCQFRFSEPAFRQVRINDREIQVRGIMYDIYSIEKVADSLLVSALADYEESHWLSVQLHRLDTDPPSRVNGTFVFLFYYYYFLPPAVCFLPLPGNVSPGETISTPSTFAATVPAPPPRPLSCSFQ